MKSCDVGIFVWTMRRDQRSGVTPTHQRKRTSAEGKSRPTFAAYKAWIIVKGEHAGQAMLAEKLGHHLARELPQRASLRTWWCNQIEVPASMKLAISTTRLSLALWISGDEAFIFE